MFVAPDSYILNILGPYFSNVQNNDANILINEFERDVEDMRDWFRDEHIFIIDRGYKNAIPTLQRLVLAFKYLLSLNVDKHSLSQKRLMLRK